MLEDIQAQIDGRQVCTVPRYEWMFETSVLVIHKRLEIMYGEEFKFRHMIGRYCCMFPEGRDVLSSRALLSPEKTLFEHQGWVYNTPLLIGRSQKSLGLPSPIPIEDVTAFLLSIGQTQAHHMLLGVSGYRKFVCKMSAEKSDPGARECKTKTEINLNHLLRYVRKGNEFLSRILAGDET
ncbi:hypothetical protein TNCV_1153111 [Trichonephila clavipes]|nr:hypothetical protein TNCV_1153111 [Trichonephila clavipes]